MTKLKTSINKEARKDMELLDKLAAAFGKHRGTIARWFYTEDTRLIGVDVLKIIADHYGYKSIFKLLEKDESVTA